MRNVIDELFESIKAEPNTVYEIDEDQVVAGMVSAGFGIAVVPYMEILHRLNVKILQISYPAWDRRFYMITVSYTHLDVYKRQPVKSLNAAAPCQRSMPMPPTAAAQPASAACFIMSVSFGL